VEIVKQNFFPCNLNNLSMKIGEKILFENVNLQISKKPITSFFGDNGSGKTTLLKIIAGLTTPTTGTVKFNSSQSLSFDDYSFLFQKSVFLNRNVYENLYYVLHVKGFTHQTSNDMISEYSNEYNIRPLLKRHPKSLSGGEQQIISFIRAIITQPKIIFLDEPFLNLDKDYSMKIENNIKSLHNKQNIKIILISHDHEQILRISNEIYEIKNETIFKKN